MTVKELVALLEKFPEDAEVVMCTDRGTIEHVGTVGFDRVGSQGKPPVRVWIAGPD